MEDAPFTCLACAQRFTDPELQREHFKLDWHRYNLKRKLAGVGPISEDAFEQRRQANATSVMSTATAGGDGKGSSAATNTRKPTTTPTEKTVFVCSLCKLEFGSRNTYESHARSKKHKAAQAKQVSQTVDTKPVSHTPTGAVIVTETTTTSSTVPSSSGVSGSSDQTPQTTVDEPTIVKRPLPTHIVPKTVSRASSDGVTESKGSDGGYASDDDEPDDADEDEEELPEELTTSHCIFCKHVAEDLTHNLEHMAKVHSFFIPDVTYLHDINGFITYLQEKVYIANVCLKCNGKGKAFRTATAVQKHMDDKGHTFLPYSTDEEMSEFDDFYDYSSALSKPLLLKMTWKHRKAGGVGGDDDVDDDDVIKEGDEGDEQSYDESMSDDDEEGEDADMPRAVIAPSGELVLPDGRIIGHRQYQRYYKQKYSPDDVRHSVMISKALALEYQRLALESGDGGGPRVSGGTTTNNQSIIVARAHAQFARRKEVASARAGEKVWERFMKHKQLRVGQKTNKLIGKYFRIQMMQ